MKRTECRRSRWSAIRSNVIRFSTSTKSSRRAEGMRWPSWPIARSHAVGRRVTRCCSGSARCTARGGAGQLALARAAGHRRHSAHEQDRTAGGEYLAVRLRPERGGDEEIAALSRRKAHRRLELVAELGLIAAKPWLAASVPEVAPNARKVHLNAFRSHDALARNDASRSQSLRRLDFPGPVLPDHSGGQLDDRPRRHRSARRTARASFRWPRG